MPKQPAPKASTARAAEPKVRALCPLADAARPVVEALERRQLLSQSPYGGTAWAPGQTVEAEHYDLGGAGVAYLDADAHNHGGSGLRGGDGVDVYGDAAAGGGHAVGYVYPGEWMEYTLDVPAAGRYVFEAGYSNGMSGPGRISASVSGAGYSASTGLVEAAATGGWSNYGVTPAATLEVGAAGPAVLRVEVAAADGAANLDWFRLTPAPSGPRTWTVAPEADAHVRSDAPAANYGSAAAMSVRNDTSPEPDVAHAAYVRFDAANFAGRSVDRATLRVRGTLASPHATDQRTLQAWGAQDSSWSESGLTWANRPALDAFALAQDDLDKTAANGGGEWVEFDVTSFLLDELSRGEGDVTLAVTSFSGHFGAPVTLAGREAGAATAAQLVVTGRDLAGVDASARGVPADAHVRNGGFADQNFGSAAALHARNTTASPWGGLYETFVKLDLSGLGPDPEVVKLRLHGRLDTIDGYVYSGNREVGVYGTGASWSESGLTWNNRPVSPTTPSLLGTTVVGDTERWYEWDVTDHVRGELAQGRTTAGLVVRSLESDMSQSRATFRSREDAAASLRPQLLVGYAGAGSERLGGAAIGTPGSYGGNGNTRERALDGDLATYFDAPAADGAWVGLDLGATRPVTAVRYAPRGGFEGRMVGGRFQGSDTADFSSGVVDLFTVASQPLGGQLTERAVDGSFRYVRYLAPAGTYGNVAEVEFRGPAGAVPTTPLPTTGGNGDAGGSGAGTNAGTGSAEGVDAGGGATQGPGSVRYADGATSHRATDLMSSGFGLAWGHTRGWTNRAGYAVDIPSGNGWTIEQMPGLNAISGTAGAAAPDTVAVITGAGSAAYFDRQGDGSYQARFHNLDTLSHDAATGTFTLVDTLGNRLAFNDFSASRPEAARGGFASHRDPHGNATSVVSRNGVGRIAEVQRTDGTATESFAYSYAAGGPNDGLLQTVTWRRRATPTAAWQTVRTSHYDYYADGDAHGRTGDLRTVTVRDAAGGAIDASLYRYYAADGSAGYAGGVKSVFAPAAYARLVGDGHDPLAVADATAAAYADEAYEYDARRRVTKKTLAGAGGDATGGQGTYTYDYGTSAFPTGGPGVDPFNTWHTQTTETLPDGSRNVVYANVHGQTMLLVEKPAGSTQEWLRFYAYDASGREVLRAAPSAVSGYDVTRPDLLDKQGGNYVHLRDAAGLVTTTSYYGNDPFTNATTTTAGGVAGREDSVALRRGEAGAAVPQSKKAYKLRTAGGVTVAPLAAHTVYRNDNGTGAVTTTYDTAYYGDDTPGTSDDTLRRRSVTVTRPPVSSSQNGPGDGVGDRETTLLDPWGRATWFRDGGGYLHLTAYDNATGGVTQRVVDVDEAQVAVPAQVAANLPADNGRHLVSSSLVDALGRQVRATDPNGNVTYTVYKDAQQETRVYAGWDAALARPTGPTFVTRLDRGRGYAEQLTMSAASATSGGVPTGTEAVGSVEFLSRDHYNKAWQLVSSDEYHNLGGLSYSASSAVLGSQGANYDRTTLGYDQRGRNNRFVDATGTVYRTLYDGLGRPASTWVGTNDAGATNADPQSGGGNNMLRLTTSVYDGGGVGDDNLTRFVTHVDASAASDRVGLYDYDWRNRLVLARNGVTVDGGTTASTESFYSTYDNLNRRTFGDRYDGQGVSGAWPTTGGVPNAPDAAKRTHRSGANYDDRGRAFRGETFSVDPATGNVGGSLKEDVWYDRRGNVLKHQAVGGLVTKAAYDGAGRPTLVSLTDGGSDYSWSDADDAAGDTVLEEHATAYDAAGNAVLATSKLRFHDAGGVGPLGTATAGVRARTSYEAFYYDRADRLTASVDVGTNGGVAYARPASVPARSDTALVTTYAYDAAGNPFSTIDPRGIEDRSEYDDLGRQTALIEAYTDGVPSDADDRITRWTYTGLGDVQSMTADLPAGQSDQTTTYNYNARTDRGDALNANNVLVSTAYPQVFDANGAAQANLESYRVDRTGAYTRLVDRNGTQHDYAYDRLGRMTGNHAAVLGSGVDGAVRQLTTTYNKAGRPHLLSSLNGSGGVVNQVERLYNGLGQLTEERQSHAGAVVTGTPKVKYDYAQALGGGKTHSRLSKVTYPDGFGLFHSYAGGVDGSISRLSNLNSGGGGVIVYPEGQQTASSDSDSGPITEYPIDGQVLEVYDYLGLGTVVGRRHPEPRLDLVYYSQGGATTGDAGDQYVGLDRFGRVVDQRWVSSASGAWADLDRSQYGYDRNGNRLYERNLVNPALSELYHGGGASGGYDKLDRLTGFARGTLNAAGDGLDGASARGQSWSLDALGNWDSVTTDGAAQTRTHDAQNRVTGVSGSTAPLHSANGEMTRDETGQSLAYDAWGRLVSAGSSSYAYDALYRRVGENGRALYYNDRWQVVQENDAQGVESRYVWSEAYVDALVLRDRDADGDGLVETAASGDERLYALYDANFNITAVADHTGAVVERYAYDPYGERTVLDAGWAADADGLSDREFRLGHQGGRHDLDAGLVSFRFRWLDTSLGRWEKQDPAGYVDGASRYQGYGGNPGAWLDPLGLRSEQPVPNLRGDGTRYGDGVHDRAKGFKNEVQEGMGHAGQAAGEIGGIVADEMLDPVGAAASLVPGGRVAKPAIKRAPNLFRKFLDFFRSADEVVPNPPRAPHPSKPGDPTPRQPKGPDTGCFVAGTPVLVVDGRTLVAGQNSTPGEGALRDISDARLSGAVMLFAAGIAGYWLLHEIQSSRFRQQAKKALFSVDPIRMPLFHAV